MPPPPDWRKVKDFQDIRYEHFEGIAKITINRPEVRNAFRPETIFELQEAFSQVRDDPSVGVVLFTGEGKEAKEIWFLCRQYSAQEALDMGLVNTVVPLDQLEDTAIQWAREILEKSPTAIRFVKAAFNAATEGLAGLQQFAGDATLLYYLTDEAREGKNAFLEKRPPDFSKYPRFP